MTPRILGEFWRICCKAAPVGGCSGTAASGYSCLNRSTAFNSSRPRAPA